jgi:arsenate reductase
VAEGVGSMMLTATVIGSGISASRLTADPGLQLTVNAAVTGAGLSVILLVVGPVSGGHLNPVMSLIAGIKRDLAWRSVPGYVAAQTAGCVAGAVLANLMFAEPAVSISTRDRASGSHLLAEVVATAGLALLAVVLVRSGRPAAAPAAVGAYIAAAYWFTSSTSFANPAITIGRMFSDTFAGIAPASVPEFVLAQLAGGLLGAALAGFLYPGRRTPAIPPSPAEPSDLTSY